MNNIRMEEQQGTVKKEHGEGNIEGGGGMKRRITDGQGTKKKIVRKKTKEKKMGTERLATKTNYTQKTTSNCRRKRNKELK